MSVYTREYVREFVLLLGEPWLLGNARLRAELQVPHPFELEEYRDGVIHYWEDMHGVQRLIDAILLQNQEDDTFFRKHIAMYDGTVAAIESYGEGMVPDRNDLKELMDTYEDGITGWIVMYYSGGDIRTPEHIRNEVQIIRAKDAMADTANHLLQKSFASLYPGVQHPETLLKRDIVEPPAPEVLAARAQRAVLYESDGGVAIQTVSIEEFIANTSGYEIEHEVVESDVTELRGTTASRGRVTGRVRVVLRRADMDAFTEGEVLVTAMTTPDYIPLMKKSVAIVTDEGGITSHAAVFSREIGKPCIIGTRIATAVLKDGDMVEVDATNGIVRKL